MKTTEDTEDAEAQDEKAPSAFASPIYHLSLCVLGGSDFGS